MQTEVILTRNIPGLGAEGDKVTVKPGYARNYLLPRAMAKLATAASVRHIELLKKKRTEREAGEKAASEELAAKIGKLTCTITVKVGAQDRMFGAVTAGDILDQLTKDGYKLDRKQVGLEKPIHAVGEHQVPISLEHGVTAQLKVVVVGAAPEPASAAAAERRGQRRGPRAEDRRERSATPKSAEAKPAGKAK